MGTRLELAALPDWPRLLSRPVAAAYCGVTAEFFEAQCPVPAIRLGSRKLWDRPAIDRWIDGLGGTVPNQDSNLRYLEALDND
ncbi:MAG: hypothetical protein ACREUU_17700 [Gammaproteobacteria bacterium]